jgi:hypothetical protein
MATPAFTEILRERAYRRLWISGFCINTARWMDLVVLGWLAARPSWWGWPCSCARRP